VTDLWNEVLEKLGSVAGKWTSFAALGTFLLYLFGYLALRFQLSAYGVSTGLDVWDERYLFAGSRFLVYLVSSVPNVILIVIVLPAIGWGPYRLLGAERRERIKERVQAWAAHPAGALLVGILFALAMIQLVLRHCFAFGDLFFVTKLPGDEWVTKLLLTDDTTRGLYFTGLVAGTLLTAGLLWLGSRENSDSGAARTLCTGLLVFLLAVEFLFLPIQYGILIASQELPRVADVSGEEKLSVGDGAWLVWETKDALVYFVRRADDQRTLVTIPKKESKVKIVGYDAIFQVLFGAGARGVGRGT
jgi:hypothetical protein